MSYVPTGTPGLGQDANTAHTPHTTSSSQCHRLRGAYTPSVTPVAGPKLCQSPPLHPFQPGIPGTRASGLANTLLRSVAFLLLTQRLHSLAPQAHQFKWRLMVFVMVVCLSYLCLWFCLLLLPYYYQFCIGKVLDWITLMKQTLTIHIPSK